MGKEREKKKTQTSEIEMFVSITELKWDRTKKQRELRHRSLRDGTSSPGQVAKCTPSIEYSPIYKTRDKARNWYKKIFINGKWIDKKILNWQKKNRENGTNIKIKKIV